METIVIVDYGMGNLDSVRRAFQECGSNAIVTSEREEIQSAQALVLPGVGSFSKGMENLRSRDLEAPLCERVIESKIPILGICLGMQLMATRGSEAGTTHGLDWVPGEVNRMVGSPSERIPHVGWNEVNPLRPHPLLKNVRDGQDFYFVHSYHFVCHDGAHELARTPYTGQITSAIGRENILGVQFHPEKSQKPGFQVIRNFLTLVN